jgi:hypothetical protein
MPADEHLGAQFFHVAPVEARESIEQHGLDPRKGEKVWPSRKYPKGTYLFGDEEAAHSYREVLNRHEADEYGMDARSYEVWNVDLPKGVKTKQDPFHEDESGLGKSSVFTRRPIPPTSLRRS